MRTTARDTLGCLLLTVALLAGALSLDPLVASGSWLPRTVLVLAVVVATLVLVRFWTRAIWPASVIALLTGLMAVGLAYAPGTQWLLVLPGPQTLTALSALGRQGVSDAATTSAPVTASTGLAMLITAAITLLLVCAEAVAIGARAPAWSGVGLLAPWAPAIVLDVPVPTYLFVVCGGSYLLLLAVHRGGRPAPARPRPRAAVGITGAGAGVVGTLVIAVVCAPLLLQLPAPRMVTEFSGTGGGGATRLSLGLDVGEHLDRGADELLYTYTASDDEEIGPLHAYTLTDFDGKRWDRGEEPDEPEPVGTGSLWPAPVPGDTSDLEMDITIENLGQDRLLLPEDPRRLSIEGEWAYDPGRDEVIGSGSTPLDYQVQIHQRQVGAADLESAQPGDVRDEHLHLPETGYQDQIATLTQEVLDEAGASTPYEQVVAVQDYLRHDPQFHYSVSVEPAQTTDAVWDFLGSGEGYCVQFATAMVMMVRTLDIPARLAVGFLPGETREDGVVEVSGHRAHAWPQVHFAGTGWVRFEPTPAARTGQSPDWTREEAQDVADPEWEDTSEAPHPPPSLTSERCRRRRPPRRARVRNPAPENRWPWASD
ncbi:MAG TPA: DUF3488 and transglutaminase-like domain-containing protein [Beutenbergiaceae bacterium]|nr:DUF3488 and transglutaminase-like domain-containing protein [Beutenbergiaceae bacterium]